MDSITAFTRISHTDLIKVRFRCLVWISLFIATSRLIIFEYLFEKKKSATVVECGVGGESATVRRVFDLLGHFRRSRVYTLRLVDIYI